MTQDMALARDPSLVDNIVCPYSSLARTRGQKLLASTMEWLWRVRPYLLQQQEPRIDYLWTQWPQICNKLKICNKLDLADYITQNQKCLPYPATLLLNRFNLTLAGANA